MIVLEKAKRGTLPLYIGRPIFFLFALDVLVAVAYVYGGWTWLSLPDVPLSIVGGVIGLITGFRNSSAYARWWEARTIWGGVVNHSRSFAREVLTMIDAPDSGGAEVKRKLVMLQIAYVHALRNHLRRTAPWPDLVEMIPASELEFLKTQSNVPLAIQQSMAALLADCYRQGWIDEIRWTSLDRTLSALMDCQGASERIKNTPMPRLYEMFIQVFVGIYSMLLPLGMVARLGLWTPFGSTFVGFIFLAFDKIGRDLETPFENLPNDISLSAICRTIEINLKEMLGDREIPEPLAAVDGVLW